MPFKTHHAVEATPQVFVGNQRVGGYGSLQAYLGKPVCDPDAVTYQPVIAVFGVAALGTCGKLECIEDTAQGAHGGTVHRLQYVRPGDS
jgi:hypothetical protein